MKQDLIEALKQLARGRLDAAETVADLLMPEWPEFAAPAVVVDFPPDGVVSGFSDAKPKRKGKA